MVGNLSWRVDDAGLKRVFQQFGHITEAVVVKDGDGKVKTFFVIVQERFRLCMTLSLVLFHCSHAVLAL